MSTASPKLGRMTVLGSGLRSQKRERNLDERHENMLYKIPAVAIELSVSISTVNRLISKGQLQTIQIGRSVRISENQLNQFISISEVKR